MLLNSRNGMPRNAYNVFEYCIHGNGLKWLLKWNIHTDTYVMNALLVVNVIYFFAVFSSYSIIGDKWETFEIEEIIFFFIEWHAVRFVNFTHLQDEIH